MSFIDDYLLVSQNSAPCKEYHVWSMLSALSAFAGRRFWLPFGKKPYFPNLYVMLVGEPATKKTSAMNIALDIVRDSGVCPVAATQITKEALTKKMSSTIDGQLKKIPFAGQKFFDHNGRKIEYNQYAIFASEFIDFVAPNPSGFLDFLTAVWDQHIIEVETKNKGHDYILGPNITFLGCMTPERVKGYLKLSILTGGFARRVAFVFSSHYELVPFPIWSPEQDAAMARCIEFGKTLQRYSGPFQVSDSCLEFYRDWFYSNEKSLTDRHHNTKSWYMSKGEYLFKLSMLIALADDPERLVIEVPHYKIALNFCLMVEKNLQRVFEGTGINPNSTAITQIIHMLEAIDRPMSRKKIEVMFMDNATSLNELRDTVTQLIQVERLEERQVIANGTLLGTVIATPGTIGRYTDDQLAQILLQPAGPPPVTYTDSIAESRPSVLLQCPMPGSDEEPGPVEPAPETPPADEPRSEAPSEEPPQDPPQG